MHTEDVCDPGSRLSGRSSLPGRLTEIAAGHTIYAVFNWAFDNLLYVYVVHKLGLLVGGLVMTSLALAQCVVTLLVYERMRIDWVGVGSLAALHSKPDLRLWERVIVWAMKKGSVFIFVALCVLQDAFITTAYFRQGRFGELKRRDWTIFFGAVFLSNLYWTLRSGAVAAVLVGGWNWLKTH